MKIPYKQAIRAITMTANEMADINEWSCCAHSKEVSAMLRQQQAEIEALKLRELTDEEIIEIWKKHYGEENVMTLDKFFVKAILQKASEK